MDQIRWIDPYNSKKISLWALPTIKVINKYIYRRNIKGGVDPLEDRDEWDTKLVHHPFDISIV